MEIFDAPAFSLDGIQPFYAPTIDETKLANVKLRLDGDRTITTDQAEQLTAVLHRSRRALATLTRLPKPSQAIHCVLKGAYALFDFIPAVLQLAGCPIDHLRVATL